MARNPDHSSRRVDSLNTDEFPRTHSTRHFNSNARTMGLPRRSFIGGLLFSCLLWGVKREAQALPLSSWREGALASVHREERLKALAALGEVLKWESPPTFDLLWYEARVEWDCWNSSSATAWEQFLNPARNQRDFDEGNVILIDGWVVSTSEAKACIAALHAGNARRCS